MQRAERRDAVGVTASRTAASGQLFLMLSLKRELQRPSANRVRQWRALLLAGSLEAASGWRALASWPAGCHVCFSRVTKPVNHALPGGRLFVRPAFTWNCIHPGRST